jgi:hypothetical protein
VSQNIFPGYEHEVTVVEWSVARNQDAVVWLREQMGQEDWRYWGSGTFKFRNDRDAVAFKLAWG